MRYVAFLRAINVGGHVVKMDRLKVLFEEVGVENVATFIASGNVLFDSRAKAPALEKKIEAHLQSTLGYPVATFLRTIDEVRVIGEARPFAPAPDSARTYIGFLKEPAEPARVKALLKMASATDELHLQGRELYWLCHKSMLESPLGAAGALEKILGVAMTMRNVNTIRRIAAK
jgi:uncharacterized protein (DUF1697 family)